MPIVDRINALSGVNTGGSIEDALKRLEENWDKQGGSSDGSSIKIEYDNHETLVFSENKRPENNG
jgi:hypothetical protein